MTSRRQAIHLTERISHINKMMEQMKKQLRKEVDILNMNIKDAINRLIIKRRAEFELMWHKYEKIKRNIENL